MKTEIFFQAYHEGELWDREDLVIPGVRINRIWDAYQDGQPMEEAGIPIKWWKKFYEARASLNSERLVIPADTRPKVLVDLPEFDQEADCYIISLRSPKRFKEHLLGKWALHLFAAEGRRGADDGTYDYYPDLWFVSQQLFSALGMEKQYEELRQRLFKTTDYGTVEDLRDYIPDIHGQ